MMWQSSTHKYMQTRFFIRKFSVATVTLACFFACTTLLYAQEPAELLQPSISISPDIFYTLEEVLYIEGRGTPNMPVLVLIQKQGTRPIKFTVKADTNGEWVVAEKTFLEAGDWEVRAQVVQDGRASEWSNPRLVRSVVTGITVANIQFKYVTLALILGGVVVVSIVLFAYFTIRVRRLRKAILTKEALEIRQRATEGFRAIRNGVLDELRTLEIHAADGQLSSEELTKKERMLDELHRLEDAIEREVRDVENLA